MSERLKRKTDRNMNTVVIRNGSLKARNNPFGHPVAPILESGHDLVPKYPWVVRQPGLAPTQRDTIAIVDPTIKRRVDTSTLSTNERPDSNHVTQFCQ